MAAKNDSEQTSGSDNGARAKQYDMAKSPDVLSPIDGTASAGSTFLSGFTMFSETHNEGRNAAEDSLLEHGSNGSRKSDDDDVHEVRNMKYWANKITHVFKRARHSKKRRKTSIGSFASSFENEFDDLDTDHTRFRPEAIDTLCQLTKFNKRELQLMYRGFKQECPSGMVKEEKFKGIYAQFFPRGAETSQYAHYVFNTFDQEHTGAITFTDFVIGLSVLARGSLQEKLRWAFSLYDINGDGYITKDEMTRIINAIYDLMGKSVEPMVEDTTTKDHVERVFQKLDLNKDGVVSMDEFLDSCAKDENISNSMSVFNTML
ncbi:Kv channel-interacting protein 1-like isoform X1 [Centruroides sculpturatus]|uniref:Kv channel-interacting protein 1-like isoform X1 n=1 Tax=Centruroides sculpturatus TaxID=218467 RepID=UPI000C6E6990|nr:Kv channel-interacting protein 1-like isoform X1 [Centruroides sculpturatus]